MKFLSNIDPKKKKFLIWLAVLLLLAILIYFYTYFFAKPHNKVIYEKDGRRIYLIRREKYGNKDREMWRMVFENRRTGERFFILGNSRKNYPEKKMAAIIINTVDQHKLKSFDQVESVGVTMRKATTDIHANMIDKKNPLEVLDKEFNFDMPTIHL